MQLRIVSIRLRTRNTGSGIPLYGTRAKLDQNLERGGRLGVAGRTTVDFSGCIQNGRDLFFRVGLFLLVHSLVPPHLVDEQFSDLAAPI